MREQILQELMLSHFDFFPMVMIFSLEKRILLQVFFIHPELVHILKITFTCSTLQNIHV